MTKIPKLFDVLKERGIKKSVLASATGISTGNISDWETGRSAPTLNKLIVVADYLNCSVDYLLGRTDEPNGVYQNSNSGNIVNGNNGNNSPLTVNGNAAAPNKDTLTEQFMQKFEQLDFDDKVDVMQYVKNKK